MKALKFWMVVPALVVGGVVGLASAKLPQAPMDDAAKAAAAAKSAKAAEGAKKAAEALSKSQDRVAERYKKEKGMKAAGPDKAMKTAAMPDKGMKEKGMKDKAAPAMKK